MKNRYMLLCKLHSRILIVTEEPSSSTFSLGLAGSIQKNCFEFLDAPVEVLDPKNTPAIPLNEILEAEYLPNVEKVKKFFLSFLIIDYYN